MKGVGTSERDITGKGYGGGGGDVHAWEKRKGSREIYRVCGTSGTRTTRIQRESSLSQMGEREREKREI